MQVFNIREAGNELLKILEKELGAKGICRLTMDVQIPEIISGDKNGLFESILRICRYLNSGLMSLWIDIDILRAEPLKESLNLHVEVRGTTGDRKALLSFVKQRGTDLTEMLRSLPSETVYSQSELHVRFSFKMIFRYAGERRILRNLFDGKRILLAEDNDVSAQVFMSFLEEWGCTVTQVSNGLMAVEAIHNTAFDLVLMDMHMPEMTGIQAIRAIRQFDKRLPIILLGASSIESDQRIAYSAGATNFISKPIAGRELETILSQYL